MYLEELTPDGLRLFYQRLLQSRQTLRLCDCANAAEFVERLGREQAFASCKAPEWNKIGELQWRFSDTNGVLTIKANKEWVFNFGSIPSYQRKFLVDDTTAPWSSFREKIFTVEIADDIDTIGNDAFWACENLVHVRIGNNVTKIGDGAFWGCESLMDIRIPDSVTEIGDYAFQYCNISTIVEIPSGAKVGKNAFHEHTRVIRRDGTVVQEGFLWWRLL